MLLDDLICVALGQFCLLVLLAWVSSAVLSVQASSMKLTLILPIELGTQPNKQCIVVKIFCK